MEARGGGKGGTKGTRKKLAKKVEIPNTTGFSLSVSLCPSLLPLPLSDPAPPSFTFQCTFTLDENKRLLTESLALNSLWAEFRNPGQGVAWVAQSKRLTSAHDLTVCELEPYLGLRADSSEL